MASELCHDFAHGRRLAVNTRVLQTPVAVCRFSLLRPGLKASPRYVAWYNTGNKLTD